MASKSKYEWDRVLGGKLIHGKRRLKRIDALLERIKVFGPTTQFLYNLVYEERQLEAARVGRTPHPLR